MSYKKAIIGVLVIATVIYQFCFFKITACAKMKDVYDEHVDMDEIDNDMENIGDRHGEKIDISFGDVYNLLMEGDIESAIGLCAQGVADSLTKEVLENRSLMLKLLMLIIIAAVFNNYSSVLKHSYVGEQGFFITYLMTCTILFNSFFIIYDMSEEAIIYISEAMECMIPAFSLSIVMCGGLLTSQMTGQILVFVMTYMEKLLIYIVLPLVRAYFLIILLNQLNAKDRFSKLAELVKQISEWILKGFITVVIGINAVKSMLVPVYENTSYNMLIKGISILPGGSSLTDLSGIMLGAGVLIKNCVGITAVIILFSVFCIPFVKLTYFYICYRLVLAAAQPISDKRILMGIEGVCNATSVLIKAVMTALALCVISISIIIISTNVKLYNS